MEEASEHQWTDSDVRDLIYMWQQEECLYNTQNKDYHNSTKRNSALERISVEIHVPVNELNEKMVGLRIYYGQLKQKVNSSKKSGAGTDEIFHFVKTSFRSDVLLILESLAAFFRGFNA